MRENKMVRKCTKILVSCICHHMINLFRRLFALKFDTPRISRDLKMVILVHVINGPKMHASPLLTHLYWFGLIKAVNRNEASQQKGLTKFSERSWFFHFKQIFESVYFKIFFWWFFKTTLWNWRFITQFFGHHREQYQFDSLAVTGLVSAWKDFFSDWNLVCARYNYML